VTDINVFLSYICVARYRDMGKSTGIWGRVQGYGEEYRDMGKSTGIWGRVPQKKGEVFLVDILHF
jgi:hypothetical protein